MKCNIVYFSPTYTTKRIVTLIANDITEDTTYFDITEPNVDIEKLSFGRNDFVIIGIPVYSGRVPTLARNIIASMRGDDTPMVLVATYGNRHYDDSLLELKNIVQSKGFLVVAAAAFVTEHSVVQKFGAGRPDDEDVPIPLHRGKNAAIVTACNMPYPGSELPSQGDGALFASASRNRLSVEIEEMAKAIASKLSLS